MLIAIMGDTFDSVLEKQQQYAMKEKISILNDFVSIVEFLSDETKRNKFIYVMEPRNKGENEGDSWDGKIGAIKRGIQAGTAEQKLMISKKIAVVQSDIVANSTEVRSLKD
jgi:hypothetical protein